MNTKEVMALTGRPIRPAVPSRGMEVVLVLEVDTCSSGRAHSGRGASISPTVERGRKPRACNLYLGLDIGLAAVCKFNHPQVKTSG